MTDEEFEIHRLEDFAGLILRAVFGDRGCDDGGQRNVGRAENPDEAEVDEGKTPPQNALIHQRQHYYVESAGEDEAEEDAAPLNLAGVERSQGRLHVTEVRISLCAGRGNRLKAFCSFTLDGIFVVRDAKLIDGNDGLFLAMPSRKLSDSCPSCAERNHLRARYCNNCGRRLNEDRYTNRHSGSGRLRLRADIAHPIGAECRQQIEKAVFQAYFRELERSKESGYIPPSLDDEHVPNVYDEHTPPNLGAESNRRSVI